MINIFLTFCAGGAAALLFFKMKVPGGMLIGAVCGTVALSLATGRAEMPFAAKFVAQVSAGAFIGCSVSVRDIMALKRMRAPAAVVILSFLALDMILGLALYSFTSLDAITALLSAVPGGMSDVPLIAFDMHADVAEVVVLQFVRLCMGIGFFPAWIAWMYSRKRGGAAEAAAEPDAQPEEKATLTPLSVAAAFFTAAACGFAGLKLHVPAGALVFSIAGTLALKLLGIPAALPKRFKRFAQVLSGTYIGCSIGAEALRDIPQLVVPAVIIVAAYMLNAYAAGNLLCKKFGIPFKEAMLMVPPAGASDMALISADIGVHSPSLVVMQIFRMLMAASVFPQICYQITKLF
ncbi:hypothetical protein B5F39_08975 [Cloacibacillus sp. An23]|nr:hypothetical protein B5F39_08975 [Cloacibacillus sp. An23]